MSNVKSDIVRDHWASMMAAALADPDQTPAKVRERVERNWPSLTTEPGGVDYSEVEVSGLPALWVVPKGSSADHVILGVHGGGGVSGSIYTHRKLFGHLAKAAGVRALIAEYRQQCDPAPLHDTVAAYRWLLDQRTSMPPGSRSPVIHWAAIWRFRRSCRPTIAIFPSRPL